MSDDGEFDVYVRIGKLMRSVPAGEGRVEKILTLLHGEGWKERARAARPSAVDRTVETYRTLLSQDRARLRDLEDRVSRIEHHLNLEPVRK